MADTARIAVTYRDRKVKATPITAEQASALALVSSVGNEAKVRVLGAVLGRSLGTVWEDVLTDMALGELTQAQLNKLIGDLVKKSAAWHADRDENVPADDDDED